MKHIAEAIVEMLDDLSAKQPDGRRAALSLKSKRCGAMSNRLDDDAKGVSSIDTLCCPHEVRESQWFRGRDGHRYVDHQFVVVQQRAVGS